MWTRRAFLIGTGCTMLSTSLPVFAAAPASVMAGPAFGTSWRVVLPIGVDEVAIRAAVETVVADVNAALSPYLAASEISRFNRSDSSDWFRLSELAGRVVRAGLETAVTTDGAFDPTVGGLVNRYGFGPIQGALDLTYANLAVRPDALRKLRPGVTYDPCGIAKGHALDLMARALAAHGVDQFLIELGGEVTARGQHPAGRSWHAGIERPGAESGRFQRIVRIDGEALATSGDGVQNYALAGRRYGHIIDPRKHRPADGGLVSVSVLAADGMTADALATALFAMGFEAGVAFAERREISALFLARDGAGPREVMTGGFAGRVTA